jgi:hypothetical protein
MSCLDSTLFLGACALISGLSLYLTIRFNKEN